MIAIEGNKDPLMNMQIAMWKQALPKKEHIVYDCAFILCFNFCTVH